MVLTGITTVVNKGAYWLKFFYGSGGSLGEVFYFGIKWLKWYNFSSLKLFLCLSERPMINCKTVSLDHFICFDLLKKYIQYFKAV